MRRSRHRHRLATLLCPAALGLGLFAAAGLLAQATAGFFPLVVTGTLVDERGAPAAGVEVVLRPYPSAWELDLHLLGEPDALPQPADRALSGPDGTFTLSAPGIGPYRLKMRPGLPAEGNAATIAPVYRDVLPLRAPLHLEPIELPDFHPLTVRALDAEGQPLEGALAFVDPGPEQREDPPYLEPHEQPERLFPDFDRAAARTGADGLARFLVPAREARVAVSAAGFAQARGTASGGRAAFRLDPAPGSVLRVRAPDGQPAFRAVVRAAGQPPVPLALTDERGEATLASSSGRRGAIEAETAAGAFGRSPLPRGSRQDGAANAALVDLALQPPAAVRGRIADAETGSAVPGAVVWLSSDPGRRTLADGAGGFGLAVPARPDDAGIGIAAGGYVSGAARIAAEELANARDISIGLVRAAPLGGWVVDAFDHPIAGANVHVEASGRGRFDAYMSGRTGRATSGPDGSFWIDNALHGSPYTLTAEAPTFASAQRELPAFARGAPVELLRIVLTGGRQPWGTVADLNGAPVAGAQVRLLWPPEDPDLPVDFDPYDAAPPATSNDRGEFEFPRVAPGPYGLALSHPDHIDLREDGVIVSSGEGYVDLGIFALTPGARIHGVVVDPNDRPVEGAEVLSSQRTRGLVNRQKRTAITDGDGRFRLGGLLPVLADVTASAPGYVSSVVESVRPATGEPIRMELTEGASLAGRVLEADGSPATRIEVALRLPFDEFRSASAGRPPTELFRNARTDRNGGFRFDDLVPATWTANAGDDTAWATLEVASLSPGERREIELRLSPSDRLTVFVTNRLGESVANASVRARPRPNDRFLAGGFGRTDAAGRAIVRISPGPATVEVEHPDLLDASREVEFLAGANELHVQLDAGGEISGVVRSGDGAPIAGATVEASEKLAGEDGGSEAAISLRRLRGILSPPTRTVSDLSGAFRLTGLEDGPYRLGARLAGYTEGEFPDAIEIDGQPVAGVEIVLEPGASIRGAVTGLDSAELASAEVQAWQGGLFRSASPGIDGAFELRELAPGAWRIAAVAGERRSTVQELNVSPGGPGAAVELRFEPGFRLSGQVLLAGEPVAGSFVQALLQGQERSRRTRTDHLGRFAIEGLEAGAYQLRFRHDLGTAEQPLDLRSDHYNLHVDLQPRPERPN